MVVDGDDARRGVLRHHQGQGAGAHALEELPLRRALLEVPRSEGGDLPRFNRSRDGHVMCG